ncbi:hypothetical protein GCM10011390_43720 [Aureimonas endophytica]|uniref:Uncharacterized protein n=1 Tax=Aureimonas endophytica TaxID=2027858 RepID=A0A916ZZ28_9HYPH|nr:DUF1217 domain-containing protein [Aureimonas endophytica]GGE19731.1 hypothetical protein GCM10011390_43720 [Aureimonas endophytica]
MVSTLLGYKLYASNMSKTLERLENTATVKRDTEYYNSHIGKVTSVEDFLDDYRLYSYAMKAYGLEDQIASKGLIRKVLQSDLSDSTSFANKLTDKKYRDFAAAFSFGATSATDTKAAQSSAQTESLVDSYSERRVRQGTAAAAKTNAYQAAIGNVASVDDLLNNTTLYDVVLSSIGADPDTTSSSFVRQALTGTLPANTSVANPKWLTLHEKFNFNADGSLVSGKTAQDAGKTNQLIYDYNVATDNNTNSYAAAFNTSYYTSKVAAGSTMTASDLLNDPRLFEYVATAYGFDASAETPSYFYNILTSDAADSTSAYSQLMASSTATTARKEQFTSLRAVFGFNTDGSAKAGGMQTAAQQTTLTDAYFKNYAVVATSKDAKQTSAFKYLLDGINSVTDLLKDNGAFGHDALNYALKAFDIDPDETSLYQVRRVLTSDVSDPDSYVNRLKDERFVKLAAAFNFDADGKVATQRLVQSTTAQTTTGQKYLQSFGDNLTTAKKDVIKTETKAYLTAIGGMSSLDDLLADQKTLDFALKAYGLDKKNLSTADVKKILTSDLSDKKSFAYSVDDGSYVAFAQAFNFNSAGTVTRTTSGVQSGASVLTTENRFLLQTLETKASDDGQEGVRLALYFKRVAPTVTSYTGVLADKALLKAVMTAYSLPDGFSQLDTDQQVSILEKKFKIEDFKDTKKLDKMITSFSALYDVADADTTNANSPILALFGGSSGSGSAANSILSLL